jgi:hypothetical protein
MYDQPVPTHYPLGARRRTRGDAETTGPHTESLANTPPDRGAPLWHSQSVEGATHFLTKTLPRVSTEMSLHVMAYNLERAMQIVGIVPLIRAISA